MVGSEISRKFRALSKTLPPLLDELRGLRRLLVPPRVVLRVLDLASTRRLLLLDEVFEVDLVSFLLVIF